MIRYYTENELLTRYEIYISSLQKQLNEGDEFCNLCNSIPFAVLLSETGSVKITAVNKKHEEMTGFCSEAIRENCKDYLESIIHPQSLVQVPRLLQNFYGEGNNGKSMSFIQYVKLFGKKDFSSVITFARQPEVNTGYAVRLGATPAMLGKMQAKMEKVLEMNQFRFQKYKQFQQLTRREVEILKLLALGLNNKVIAGQLFVSRQTIETHRKNIKAKLSIHSYKDLMKYALVFDLIKI